MFTPARSNHLARRRRLPAIAMASAAAIAILGACSGGSGSAKVSAGSTTTLATDEATTTTAATATEAGDTSDTTTAAAVGAATPGTTAKATSSATKSGSATTVKAATGASPTTAKKRDPVTVRLGYFPNVTHAPAIVGVEGGYFEKALGSDKLKTSTFNAGPEATEALFAGAIDATFIGPNPAINAYAQSKGAAIRIISGTTSGGAALVVKPDINSAADLKGKKVGTPQLGNTQDVALRFWLSTKGLKTDTNGGGDVSVTPQSNSQSLQTFRQGTIAGAWVPEPWATRLVQEGGGKILLDERDLWPGGKFVTTHLIVRTQFLKDHPEAVKGLITGLADTIEWMDGHAAEAQQITDAGISKATGQNIGINTITASWPNMLFTTDPIASSLDDSAKHANAVGLLDSVDLKNIYDLTLLNQVLSARGKPVAAGL